MEVSWYGFANVLVTSLYQGTRNSFGGPHKLVHSFERLGNAW